MYLYIIVIDIIMGNIFLQVPSSFTYNAIYRKYLYQSYLLDSEHWYDVRSTYRAWYDGIWDIPTIEQSVAPLHHAVTHDNAILTLDVGVIVPGRCGNIHIQYAK